MRPTSVFSVFILLLATVSAPAEQKLSGDLAKAIRSGDLDAVKTAVEAGADINALDERKMPPIGAAALLGKTDIVNYLADKGADLNRNDGYGFTPLMCAAQRGQAGAVKALLKHGADPSLKGANGNDALTYAAPKGPADPLFDEKTAVIKALKDAIEAKKTQGAQNSATPAKEQPAATENTRPAANAQPVEYGVGAKVNVLWHGTPYPSTILKVDGAKRFIHYDNFGDNFNEWVTLDAIRPLPGETPAAAKPTGERVEALSFSRKWTDATVLKTDGNKKFVHFDGMSDIWDEWVLPERIRPIGTTNALALQHPAPDQPGTKGLSGWIVGTAAANGRYVCTFYWFQPDGHVFISDTMPKGWADLTFAELQKTDAVHCGTYGINGDRMTVQMNGANAQTIGFGPEVIGKGIRQPLLTYDAGQRFEGGFSVDSVSNFGGVTATASDSWYFHADGTFKRVSVVGVQTNDAKGDKDPHPAKAQENGDNVTQGRYEFSKGRLQLTAANGQTQTLSCYAFGTPDNPSMLGIGDVQYKANVDNKPAK